ncbi:MAG TPA: hypothetical protein VMT62_12670 [Syntrophorhabdaceae bacterium]|nr:hypothetical protein [Syntrophorhabdaceae bacterium]
MNWYEVFRRLISQGDGGMTSYETWSLIIQIAAWVATLFLAFIAIWGDRIRSKWSGPKLRLFVLNSTGEVNPSSDGAPVRYYHLRVTNDRKGAPARNVRVMLTKILQLKVGGRPVDRSFSGPLQLTWQFPAFHPQTSSIGPDDVCDLGNIMQGRSFALTPYVVPNNFAGYVGANEEILVEVVAIADNGQSEPINIKIAWDGGWSDDDVEMRRHLVVK